MSVDPDDLALSEAIALFIELERFYKTGQHYLNNDTMKLTEEEIARIEASSLFNESFADITGISLKTFISGLLTTDAANQSVDTQPLVSDNLHEDTGKGSTRKYRNAQALLQVAKAYIEKKEPMYANRIYLNVGQYMVGHRSAFPSAGDVGVKVPTYQDLRDDCRRVVMSCCQGLSDGAVRDLEHLNFTAALGWLYEMELVVKSRRYGIKSLSQYHDWDHFTGVRLPPLMAFMFIDAFIAKAEKYRSVGNTAANQYYLTIAAQMQATMPPLSGVALVCSNALQTKLQILHQELFRLRHPDPESKDRFLIVDSRLQLRGAWKKVPIQADTSHLIMGKTAYAVFIWNGHLYMIRGWNFQNIKDQSGPHQVHRLNLKRPDKWEFVTKCPAVRGQNILGRICVHKNKMYSFLGHPIIDVLDLTNNKWSTLKTTFKSSAADRAAGIDPVWPWPRKICTESAVVMVENRMLVFGGINGDNIIGCNLFMELDLKTLKWRRLNGTPTIMETHNPDIPGPRASGGSWVSSDQKKMYIFSGVCAKTRPDLGKSNNGPSRPWTYNDLWSWDIEAKVWREERMCGNIPAPRSTMGCVYCKKLDKVVVFGGANQTCSAVIGKPSSNSQVYAVVYADTFIWNPPGNPDTGGNSVMWPHKWQQVQTIGFPTYRNSCHLVEDPDTGDVYLYGGDVLGDTLPSKNHTEVERRKKWKHEPAIAQALASHPEAVEAFNTDDYLRKTYTHQFTDMWKLHLDIPGGDFESVDIEDELRTAALGPWQRCFVCLQTGFWKKCGGSCAGKAFFCSSECQSSGWREHKRIHDCKKLSLTSASSD